MTAERSDQHLTRKNRHLVSHLPMNGPTGMGNQALRVRFV